VAGQGVTATFISDPGVILTRGSVPRWGTDSPAVGGAMTIKVTNPFDGAVIADLGARAVNNAIHTRKATGPEQYVFSAPCADAGVAEIVPFFTQVQVFRGGHLDFRGWVIHIDQPSDSPFDTFTCLDSLFITSRRFWSGSPWAREWLRNPRFDDDFTSWTNSDCTLDTVDFETGTQSVQIGSISQVLSPDLSSNPWGATIQARVKVAADVVEARGLEVRVAALGVGNEPELVTSPITASTPRDVWTTLTVQLPPKSRLTPGIEVLVNNTDPGIVKLDRVSFRITQADGANIEQPPNVAVDARALFAGLLGDLGIGFRHEGSGGAGIAIDVDRFGDELYQTAVDAGIADIWMEYTRTTETVVESTPRRGRTIPTEELSFSWSAATPLSNSIAAYQFTADYTKAASEVVAIGEDGFHGVSTDPTNPWGILLQESVTAPNGTAPGDLEAFAERQRRTSLGDVRTLTIRPVNLVFGAIEPGDVVWVEIDYFTRQAAGWYRIGEFTQQPKLGFIDSLVLTAEPV
jgi:hypothetical protein